jgi:thioredoxin 1
MPKPIELTAKNFAEEVLQSKIPVLVDFWAPWCQPCIMMGPALEELASEFEGKLKIAKLNIENKENQKLAMEYQVQSIPNMKLFRDGKIAKELVGLRPKETLKSELESEI